MGYFFGAPIRASDRKAFIDAIEERSEFDKKEAYNFIDGVLNRISSKASAILSFNSIFLAVNLIGLVEIKRLVFFVPLTMISLSSILLMFTVSLDWSSDSNVYRSFADDLDRNLRLCLRRAYFLTLAIYLSGLSVLTILFSIVYHSAGLVG